MQLLSIPEENYCERSFPRTTAPGFLTAPSCAKLVRTRFVVIQITPNVSIPSLSKRYKLFQCTVIKFHYKVKFKQSLYKGQKH